MADHTDPALAGFLDETTNLLTPVSGLVGFGNVRMKVTRTTLDSDRTITNCAITYESPGGSTNQINVVFEHSTSQFRVLNDESGEEELFSVSTPIVAKLAQLIQDIPRIRMDRLKWDIDRWIADGKSRAQILMTLSRMLQADSGLRGGGITQDELNEASRYLAQRMQ